MVGESVMGFCSLFAFFVFEKSVSGFLRNGTGMAPPCVISGFGIRTVKILGRSACSIVL